MTHLCCAVYKLDVIQFHLRRKKNVWCLYESVLVSKIVLFTKTMNDIITSGLATTVGVKQPAEALCRAAAAATVFRQMEQIQAL